MNKLINLSNLSKFGELLKTWVEGRISTKLDDAPKDNKKYARQNGLWASITEGSQITVDSSISETSVNPVQNKIIYAELVKKIESSDVATAIDNFNANVVAPLSNKVDNLDYEVATEAEIEGLFS